MPHMPTSYLRLQATVAAWRHEEPRLRDCVVRGPAANCTHRQGQTCIWASTSECQACAQPGQPHKLIRPRFWPALASLCTLEYNTTYSSTPTLAPPRLASDLAGFWGLHDAGLELRTSDRNRAEPKGGRPYYRVTRVSLPGMPSHQATEGKLPGSSEDPWSRASASCQVPRNGTPRIGGSGSGLGWAALGCWFVRRLPSCDERLCVCLGWPERVGRGHAVVGGVALAGLAGGSVWRGAGTMLDRLAVELRPLARKRVGAAEGRRR